MATLKLITSMGWERTKEILKSKQGMEDKTKGVGSVKGQDSFFGKKIKTQDDPPSSEADAAVQPRAQSFSCVWAIPAPLSGSTQQEARDRFLFDAFFTIPFLLVQQLYSFLRPPNAA